MSGPGFHLTMTAIPMGNEPLVNVSKARSCTKGLEPVVHNLVAESPGPRPAQLLRRRVSTRILKDKLLTFLICLVLSLCGQCAERPLSSEAVLLAHWMTQQQYLDPTLPSYGGLKIGAGVAGTSTNGTSYCRVSITLLSVY